MSSICITIPKSISWKDYEKELKAVEDGKMEMHYKVHVLPRDVNVGDRCYVCHDGFVRGSRTANKNLIKTMKKL